MTKITIDPASGRYLASLVGGNNAPGPQPIGFRVPPGCLVFALIAVLAAGCATTMPAPQDFLRSSDASWNQWMDKVVDVQLTDVRIAHLPLTDAFLGVSIVIARADAPLRWLPVTLHAQQITRRQALWLISKRYGLKMTVESVPGQPPYIGIAIR